MTAKEIYDLIRNKPYKDGEKMIKEYCKEQNKELLEALKTVYDLIDKGDLVRDISRDGNFNYFAKQGIRIRNAIFLGKQAIKKPTE